MTDLEAQYGAMCVLHLEAELGDVEIVECLAFADTERNTEVIRCRLELMAAYAFSVVLLGFTFVGMVASKATKKLATNSPKSPLAKPKQLFLTLSNKASSFKHKKKVDHHNNDNDNDDVLFEDDEEIDFGDEGLWQRNILMGDKCQPLDFSGVIYYDCNGNQLSELPMRSPARASPLPSYLSASSEK
ncbi:hypothetical protein ACH5RR_025013 [Cinchona calisaya]|uniref:Uncharacterized protein n=1 Tax=Cinchona calisaya TaxID=153742 RepID=A0ABD2YZ53_9GENT